MESRKPPQIDEHRVVSITGGETPPGGFRNPRQDTVPMWALKLQDQFDSLHGEFQLLRADVNAKLATQAKAIRIAQLLGVALATAATQYLPELKGPIIDLLKAFGGG